MWGNHIHSERLQRERERERERAKWVRFQKDVEYELWGTMGFKGHHKVCEKNTVALKHEEQLLSRDQTKTLEAPGFMASRNMTGAVQQMWFTTSDQGLWNRFEPSPPPKKHPDARIRKTIFGGTVTKRIIFQQRMEVRVEQGLVRYVAVTLIEGETCMDF